MDDDDRTGATALPARVRTLRAAVLSLLVLVVVVVAAAASGPWVRAPLPGSRTSPASPPSVPAESVSVTEAPFSPESGLEMADRGGPVRVVMLVLAALLVLAVALLVLRLVLALRGRGPAAGVARTVLADVADDELDAPALREGIERARRILEEGRRPEDAVLQAWLALEAAARSAGVARTPSQTPTEFTAVVLARTPAEREPVRLLCRLYLRARFSDEPVGPDDAEPARTALARVAQSWADVGAST